MGGGKAPCEDERLGWLNSHGVVLAVVKVVRRHWWQVVHIHAGVGRKAEVFRGGGQEVAEPTCTSLRHGVQGSQAGRVTQPGSGGGGRGNPE